MPEVYLPPGFKEVMACLQRDPSHLTASKAPLEPMHPEAIVKPTVAMVCASCILQDEAMESLIWTWSPLLWSKWPSEVPTQQLKPPDSPLRM